MSFFLTCFRLCVVGRHVTCRLQTDRPTTVRNARATHGSVIVNKTLKEQEINIRTHSHLSLPRQPDMIRFTTTIRFHWLSNRSLCGFWLYWSDRSADGRQMDQSFCRRRSRRIIASSYKHYIVGRASFPWALRYCCARVPAAAPLSSSSDFRANQKGRLIYCDDGPTSRPAPLYPLESSFCLQEKKLMFRRQKI